MNRRLCLGYEILGIDLGLGIYPRFRSIARNKPFLPTLHSMPYGVFPIHSGSFLELQGKRRWKFGSKYQTVKRGAASLGASLADFDGTSLSPLAREMGFAIY